MIPETCVPTWTVVTACKVPLALTVGFALADALDTTGDVATLNGFTLVDVLHGKQVVFPTVPQTADATLNYAAVDYDFSNGAQAPVAAATVSTPSSYAIV